MGGQAGICLIAASSVFVCDDLVCQQILRPHCLEIRVINCLFIYFFIRGFFVLFFDGLNKVRIQPGMLI